MFTRQVAFWFKGISPSLPLGFFFFFEQTKALVLVFLPSERDISRSLTLYTERFSNTEIFEIPEFSNFLLFRHARTVYNRE